VKLPFNPAEHGPLCEKRVASTRYVSFMVSAIHGPVAYDDIKNGTFPRPISLGPRAVGWPETSINAWIEGRIAVSAAKGRRQ
jgi:predicted DNA-binding transcriptional regulator AlpA